MLPFSLDYTLLDVYQKQILQHCYAADYGSLNSTLTFSTSASLGFGQYLCYANAARIPHAGNGQRPGGGAMLQENQSHRAASATSSRITVGHATCSVTTGLHHISTQRATEREASRVHPG